MGRRIATLYFNAIEIKVIGGLKHVCCIGVLIGSKAKIYVREISGVAIIPTVREGPITADLRVWRMRSGSFISADHTLEFMVNVREDRWNHGLGQ